MNIDVSVFPERAASLEETQHNIRVATDPAAAEPYIRGQLEEFGRQFDFQGVNVAPPQAMATAETRLREEYDENLRRSIAQYESDLATFEREIEQTIGEAEDIPGDPALHASNDHVRLLARSVQLTEQDQAERRMHGKTRQAILREYTALPEGEAARVIEREVLNGFANVTLAQDRNDAEAIIELKGAVNTRRAARAKAAAPAAFDAKARIAALKKSVTSSVLRDHMKSGRGVAATLHVVNGGSR